MKKSVAWSHSALDAFETCPKRYFHTRVKKDVSDPPSAEVNWGRDVHKAMEKRLKDGTPLPTSLQRLEPLALQVLSKPGKRIIEGQLAINSSFAPTKWFDQDAWCRAVVDCGVVGEGKAVLLDWKTGKRKPDSDQLKLSAAIAFSHYPYVRTVYTSFVWLKDSKLDTEVYYREQTGEIWSSYLPRVKRLEIAYAEEKWPPKPSGLCGKWCPVTKQQCDFGR